MAKTKEKATLKVRVYPSTHKVLKIVAAKEGLRLPELINKLIEAYAK